VRVINRDTGQWDALDICQLYDSELDEFAEAQGPERGWMWEKTLARLIRDQFNVEFVATEDKEEE